MMINSTSTSKDRRHPTTCRSPQTGHLLSERHEAEVISCLTNGAGGESADANTHPDDDIERGDLNQLRDLGIIARGILKGRRSRDDAIPSQILGEPGWDILLDLFAAEAERKLVSVSNACIAANVPATTALRYIANMETLGLIKRTGCRSDKRICYLSLTQSARRVMIDILSGIHSSRQSLEILP